MMQILHIDTEKTWRGGENQMRLLIEGLGSHQVTSHIAAQPDSEIHKRLKQKVPLHIVPMRGELDIFAAKSIAAYCKKHRISILDCQTSHAHSLGLLSKLLFNPQLQLVVHRRVDYPPRNGFFNRLKYGNKAVDCYIAISHKISQILHEYGIAKERIATVPSAISAEAYSKIAHEEERRRWSKRLGVQLQTPLIGQAAAMTDQKGYDTLLHSLAVLKKDGIPFHCVLAGDGVLKPSLEALCKSLGLQEQVSFLGWIDEIPSFLASLDIFFMPSNYEGLGTTLLEAVYAGCCIVASRVGGIPEIVLHEKTGLLAPPKDHLAFSEQLKKAIANPKMRQELNTKARQHATKLFSLDAMVQGNLQVYRSLFPKP